MDAQQVDALTAADMERVNRKIQVSLSSDVALINQMGAYILNAGGKRMRPRLVLMSALANGYRGDHHINLAALVEFIHTATLLHDDVVDASLLRRGQDTANSVWGNEAAVLVGDFLYSRSFEMMVEVGEMRVMEVLSSATNTIAAGEVLQLLNVGEADISVQTYMDVITAKTAKLFEAATRLGAIISDAEPEVQQQMAAYGSHLGIAFQLIDDVLDYTAAADEMGKNTGDDLAEGKPTLPLIFAMQDGPEATREKIRNALGAELDQPALTEILQAVRDSGAIRRTREMAEQQVALARAALDCLEPSEFRQALDFVAQASVDRKF